MDTKAYSQSITTLPPLALYLHFPWCARKCPYCDFNSHQKRVNLDETGYAAALVTDLERTLPMVWGRPITTVFLGGGTPSLFSADTIARLLSDIRARLPLQPGAEITMEANPGTVERGAFASYRDAGVNRLSLGIQSFNNTHLTRLERIHDRTQALTAITEAASAGFDQLNLDLMFALPQQTLSQALEDLATALSFSPNHISLYQLTLEPHTAFHKHPPAGMPDPDQAADMETALRERLQSRAFPRYEISAHAQAGYASRHNMNYWRFGDYLGIGAGAHGKITMPDGVYRTEKPTSPDNYVQASKETETAAMIGTSSKITPQSLSFEFMLNAMRLVQGVESRLFTERTGLPLSAMEKPLTKAKALGLIRWDHQTLAPTETGLMFQNDLLSLFLAES